MICDRGMRQGALALAFRKRFAAKWSRPFGRRAVDYGREERQELVEQRTRSAAATACQRAAIRPKMVVRSLADTCSTPTR